MVEAGEVCMSEKLWLFNTMAKRRRSASDTFEENGLGILEAHLKNLGHEVRIVDYAVPATYRSLTPALIARLTRGVYSRLIRSAGKKSPASTFLKILAVALQGVLSRIQEGRMRRLLTGVAREAGRNRVPLFGMKLWYGEAFTWAKYLADEIHKYSPETVVIGGGYHATLYEEDILRYSNFDLAVAGDGEQPLDEMLKLVGEPWDKTQFMDDVKTLIKDGRIRGGICRNGAEIVKADRENVLCDEIKHEKAIPVYRAENDKAKVHILLESMGCPWNKCNFCVHNQFDKTYVKRRVSDLMDEIEAMIGQGIAMFRFTGSDTPPDFGAQIATAIMERGFKMEFTMGSRAVKGAGTPEMFRRIVESYVLLARSGLKAVFIGGETGNDVINDKVMNKGICRDDLVWTIKAIREAEARTGVHVNVSLAMIYPTPLVDGITNEDVRRDNLSLISECMPDSVMITPPGPFKNSAWNTEKERFGFKLGPNMVKSAMEYEYVLYKPLNMWPDMDIHLYEMSFRRILEVSQAFRNEVQNGLGVPTDLSDEHFLMMQAAGITGREGIREFKLNAMLDLIACDYAYIDSIGRKVSERSRKLAASNGNHGSIPFAAEAECDVSGHDEAMNAEVCLPFVST
ncbi:MAG: hypothetical protein C0404_03595 [Verrucomicrobia bacterium]|nr:hypothetical protein [Verrucomicrobiota bacterium]